MVAIANSFPSIVTIRGKLMKSLLLRSLFVVALGLSVSQIHAQEPTAPANTVDVAAFNELLKSSKWDEAATMVDEGLKETPDSPKLLSLSLQLANRTMRAQPEAAAKRFSDLIGKLTASPKLTIDAARDLQLATNMYSMMLMQQSKIDEAIDVVKRSLTAVAADGTTLKYARRELETNLARLYMNANKSSEALELMRSSYQEVKVGAVEGKESLSDLVRATNTFANLFDEVSADEAAEYTKFAEELIVKKLDGETPKLADLLAYYSMRSMQLSQLTYSDPARGIELANELKSRIEAFPEPSEASEVKQLESLGKSLQSLLGRLESSMARERLIGTLAPEYEAESFVGMEETSLASLKGKVVLLDFWAVWCGPCIATFPHLRDWHDAYSDKGFVVLGMTSDQGFTWDEEKQMAVRGTDVTHEQELEMLASFRNFHKLRHGFVLTPKGEYNKKLAVSGIPQAVLLDKQGVIRMIKVGSGEKNAHDLEAMIEKLLAEDSKPVETPVQ